ncbi:protein split ends isoform X2 [Musca domestica]|uniref:Protein split ends isoform X2 n=1 Tax=Musca domestica TaxID=7370 RepID=A0ABM3V6Z3_MUSDO|nr:protein split ends isoform X2 [Musca domestica]
MSTEDVSPPNFSERNSGYYERNSRLVADTDSYLRRSNSNNTISNYQSSSNSTSNLDNSRSRTRDRVYRNGPYATSGGLSSSSSSAATTILSERSSSGGAASKHNNNNRVPPASWYEAAATYTNGPGGSGNADVSAANINNHYQTAASTDTQAATATQVSTANSSTNNPTAYNAYSYVSSPAHKNNSNSSLSSTATTASSSSTTAAFNTPRNNSASYGNASSAAGHSGGYYHHQQRDNDSGTDGNPLLNKNKHKLLKSCSSSSRSGSASPTSSAATAGVVASSTMTSSSTSAASAANTTSNSSSSSSSTAAASANNNNNNQTANNSSCSSISSTINSSNTNNHNNSLLTSSSSSSSTAAANAGDSSRNVSGILNAAALAAAASNGSSSTDGHHNHKGSSSSSNNVHSNSTSSNANSSSTSNNPSTSASHHTSRAAVHAHLHGRSTTSSSRSHSRSPSSYSSSHSSSSSSSSTASSHSHASSPVGGRDVETSTSTAPAGRGGSRSLQSAVAVPGTSSALNPSGSNACSSSSSSSSSTGSGTPSTNPVVHSEDNRPLAIRVRNLPARSSDTSLKDGLFHEYKKHGKVTWVKVVGQNAERYALVCFKKPEDVEKALEVSHDKLFFGCKIEVEPYQGYDVEDNEFRPYEAELDEYHPKSTRTLFIGNLEKEITASELRLHFECFGEIIEIDIKKQGMSAYAFCQYSDIVSVVKAMRKMDGEHLGNNRIKLGFGKSMPTNCVWIDGIGEKISESHLQSQFSRYGAVSKVVIDRQRQLALVLYEQIQYAQTAVKEMRGATLRGRKLQVDFASRECQDAFYEKLEKQAAGSRFSRYESQSRSRASSFSRHQNSNDGCSPSNTPGSSSSSSAGIPPSAPTLSSAIVAGSSINSNPSGTTLPSVVGQASGNTTPARSRGSRSSRHTMDYDYIDTRRFRSYDEYSQGSGASHDEDAIMSNHPTSSSNANSYSGIGLRSDSPLLSRLGPIVNNSSGKESNSDMLEMALSRRRCDKSPAKQKGDVRLFQKERAVLLEQLEEYPSSGDESIVSPRKRIKIDHHSINSSSGLSQSHSLEEQTQQQNKNSNCDYLLNDSLHRKGEVRRLSECSNSLNKYQQQANHHHHSHHSINPHHHHHQQQHQLSRRPSIDYMATGGGGGGVGASSSIGGGSGNLSTRHGSTSSSNSDHHPPPHQSSSSSSSLACKRRRVIGSSGSSSALSTNAALISSGSSSGNANLASSSFGSGDDFHHHASRGRGHQLHSHHSHEASGGESADGSRPGTPLCDERPEVLPSEPRRVPRERPREPMVLPLPKFGILFFQQYRSNNGSSSNMGATTSYHHHHSSSGFASSSTASAAVGSTNSGSSHMLSNSLSNRGVGSGEGGINSNHSSHSSITSATSSATTTTTPGLQTTSSSSGGGCYLPSPSSRYQPWRPHTHHHHHHGSGGHHGGGATPSSSSSMVSPMRSRSLSSNSSDSDVTGQASGSPSLEERIRTLDEMYERWSGGGSSTTAAASNVAKRHDFSNTPPTWQHHRSSSQTDLHHSATTAATSAVTSSSTGDVRQSSGTPSTPASRHKFLDIDVKEIQPSEIVKSVLAKKSIFDDDLQRLKKNHWYEPSTDSSQMAKNAVGVCTSPGLPNLQATKTPVVGNTLPMASAGNTTNKTSGALLQRLTSLSPMNSPQASMSPYNSPSMSPSVNSSSTLSSLQTGAKTTATCSSGNTMASPSPVSSGCATGAGTPPAPTTASSGSKCLQYPFPTHPPLPNTAAPSPNNQPIPPPPAEMSKPPPLPPMEVHQPPQPPPVTAASLTTPTAPQHTVNVTSKPKTSTLSKSLSVPTAVGPAPTSAPSESPRTLTKSVSVPGSTNVGTIKTTAATVSVEQKQQLKMQTGNSSSTETKTTTASNPTSVSTISETAGGGSKRSDNNKSHKHNHRSSDEKKSSKSDKRKNSNSSQSQISQVSAAESSDADERDFVEHRKERESSSRSEKQKERQEKREKELRKQQEREEREREEREREERERLEKERLERERLEKERLEQEEQERVQREKERLRKEEEKAREERERKEREENERKLKEQQQQREREKKEREERERKEREERERKEREELERKEREENERRKREEQEERLRKERKEREESELREKERLERQRSREEKERERKLHEEIANEKRELHSSKENHRRKENPSSVLQQEQQTKGGNASNDLSSSGGTTSNQTGDHIRHGESEKPKESSTTGEFAATTAESASGASSGKHKNRKTSRNTSPVRHPKRRLSSQDSNASNSGGNAESAEAHAEDAKRMRIDTHSTPSSHVANNHASNAVLNEKRESKEQQHHSKDRNNKHSRLSSSSSSSHRINLATSSEKEHNAKHHRNKHHHQKQQQQQSSSQTEQQSSNTLSGESTEVTTNAIKSEGGDKVATVKIENEPNNSDHEVETTKTKSISSEDEETSHHQHSSTNKPVSGSGGGGGHKHKEHGSGGSHHSRHKSGKRDREHHREKKRHSTPVIADATPAATNEAPTASTGQFPVSANISNVAATDDEHISSSVESVAPKRTSSNNSGNSMETQTKPSHKSEHVTERKHSRGSEEPPQTPSSRQSSAYNKSTPQSGSRKILLSSAEDTDGGGGGLGCDDDDDDSDSMNRKHSIFDIPDEGPYVSMYDKVKARSCKNMQKQEEEKKIKAKFCQLKQSRAKREEKKRSTSYDGDSDSDFDNSGDMSSHHHRSGSHHNRSGGGGSSYKMLSGALTSSDDDQDQRDGQKSPCEERRRNSQASSSAASTQPNRLCSDSDDSEIQRGLKLQDNIRRLCAVDDSSDDDLIRRNSTSGGSKRLLHHTSRIASDSESQSQPPCDIKLKQEPIETSNDDGTSTPILKQMKYKIKKEEVENMETSAHASAIESSDFDDIKPKHLNLLHSNTSEAETSMLATIKSESNVLTVNEIKKEYKDFYGDDYVESSEDKFQKSDHGKIKKHKKSKKRQKTPTQDGVGLVVSTAKESLSSVDMQKSSGTSTVAGVCSDGGLDTTTTTTTTKSNAKNVSPQNVVKHLPTSPNYDPFDELKNSEPLNPHILMTDSHVATVGEKKRHKDRKEKKREKLRHMSADIGGQGIEMDKLYEKEKHHRLKKSKKSKSLDMIRQLASQSSGMSLQIPGSASSPTSGGGCSDGFTTSQQKQRSGEKMEDIFGPISDEEEEMTDSDIGAGRDLNCLPNRNALTANVTGPIVSAALNPYKQEPLTPKSHTVEENEENKQKCPSLSGPPSHIERSVERQHRKEKREKKRKDREKSRGSGLDQSMTVVATAAQFMPSPAAVSSTTTPAKPLEDENSVDLDAAGRALEAQLMEDSDNKATEDATPSTATTYRSDMTDVFRFSDGDENSLEVTGSSAPTSKHENRDVSGGMAEKEHATNISLNSGMKTKKKKKKRSKEEKQLHHQQRRESSSSNASQHATNASQSASTAKLTIDIAAANKNAQKLANEEHGEQSSTTKTSPLCKPSPSLPCLIGDDDEEILPSTTTQPPVKTTPNTSLTCATACTTPHRSSSKDLLSLSPHMRGDKQMISPIPKTPTISNTSGLNSMENMKKLTPTTPTSSTMDSSTHNTNAISTTPTSSTVGNAAANAAAAGATTTSTLNKSTDSTTSSTTSTTSNAMVSPTTTSSLTSLPPTQKKKPDIFIPGFDGEIDEKISESAVQSISAEFNPPLDPTADEPKIPVESPPDASKLEKLEESKSRVTISQEETESAVSALLGESFGNSSADYSFDDDVPLDDLNSVSAEPEPVMMTPAEPDEEAALAAKAIECEVESNPVTDVVVEDTDAEEVCKAIQSLRQEELELKSADTPQSVRDLQIDTDTEENADEADSSGSHSLKIDETAQSNNSSSLSEKAQNNTTSILSDTQGDNQQMSERATEAKTMQQQQQSSVITKMESTAGNVAQVSGEPKLEPPTISKQDQPAVQPVQSVIPATTNETITSVVVSSVGASALMTSSSSTSSMTSGPATTISCTSTPTKTSITFAPSATTSSTPKQQQALQSPHQATIIKPLSLPQTTTMTPATMAYVMQPPTISIPDPTPHFVVPQMVLSPHGVVTATNVHDSSASSSSLSLTSSTAIHSPQSSGIQMPPQSPLSTAYIMGMRAQSPHSPRNTSRGNTPTPRQQSPHTPTPPPPVTISMASQQNILIQRGGGSVHQQQSQMSPNNSQLMVGTQSAVAMNSPMASPNSTQSPRQQQQQQHLLTSTLQKMPPHSSPSGGAPEQHMIKINNYSTPPMQTANVVSIRIPPPQNAQNPQQCSPHAGQQQQVATGGKPAIEQHQQQHSHPIGQHILPISVQKMPPVPSHPTIISKVVTVTPQQAQQSTMPPHSPGGLQNQQNSPKSAAVYSPPSPSSRHSPQIIQQMGNISVQQQQQQSVQAQIQMIQQQRQQQQHHQQQRQQMHQHIMQMQHQQMFHQQQQQQKMQQQQQQQQQYVANQQQQRGPMNSPQQLMPPQQHQHLQHTQAPQQPTMHQLQSHQIKSQYQQLHPSSASPQSPHASSSSTQPTAHASNQQPQQNVIQTPTTPQRFLVQQHIVGIPHLQTPQSQQQQNIAMQQQQRSSPTMQQQHQQSNVVFGKSPQQLHLQSLQQSPSMAGQQRSPVPTGAQQETSTATPVGLTETVSRIIVSTPQTSAPTVAGQTTAATTGDNNGVAATQPKHVENVSVIRTPTPTNIVASTVTTTAATTTSTIVAPPTQHVNKETTVPVVASSTNNSAPANISAAEPATSLTRASPITATAALTEENITKISPPKHDEIEQDSKEDSDYWSAKELNVVEPNSGGGATTTSSLAASSVIKKNDNAMATSTSVATPSTNTLPINTNPSKQQQQQQNAAATTIEDAKAAAKYPQTQPTKSTTDVPHAKTNSGDTISTVPEPVAQTQPPTSTASYNVNPANSSSATTVNTDHDTEDETETQQMPAFEQISVQGRPNTRGTGAKRGRQPRGGKKAAAVIPNATPAVAANQLQDIIPPSGNAAGVQTRLRKPNAATPATRGRKGRPPRNLLLQQQQQQQQELQTPSTVPSTNVAGTTGASSSVTGPSVLTAAEKKARSQAASAAATLASLSEVHHHNKSDVYEFHDDSGEESGKSGSGSAAPSSSSVASSIVSGVDNRPRLILTIKSPHNPTPVVKTSEKIANEQQPTPTATVAAPLSETSATQQQQPQQQSEIQSSAPTSGANSAQTEGDLNSLANTRKSRRLLEKDRSTIDDIIEDVVRNTAVPPGAGQQVSATTAMSTNNPQPIPLQAANVISNALPKGAQTPPRRSGRTSAATQPKSKTGIVGESAAAAAVGIATTTPNAIGRPRKSKDRKSINEMDSEQSIASPQPPSKGSGVVHEIVDLDDTPENPLKSGTQSLEDKQQPPTSAVGGSVVQPPATSSTVPVSAAAQQSNTNISAPQSVTSSISSTIPQHPKKKALAAAEIESYQNQGTVNTSNIHSALPSCGGVPMLNTAAPASQKTTGGAAADSVNKPVIDTNTAGIVSGQQMQQAKAGNLPSATAAAQPQRPPLDPKKMMQAAVAAAAAVSESSVMGNKPLSSTPSTTMSQASVATPITALTKPVQAETATAAAAAASSVTTALLNKSSVSVVVKTSTVPSSPATATHITSQQVVAQTHQQQTRPADISTPTKQPIIMQQQTPLVMHAQHTNVRPPTSLKAHVLNSQKLQQQQQQLQMSASVGGQQQQQQQQQQQHHHQQLHAPQTPSKQQQTHHLVHQQSGTVVQQQPPPPTGHVIQQANIVQRQTPPQAQMGPIKQQLLVNIPPPTTQHSPHATAASNLNSPRMQHQPQVTMPQQPGHQQSIIMKQGDELHPSQILHVVSSKATPPTPNKSAAATGGMVPSAVATSAAAAAASMHLMQQAAVAVVKPFNPYLQQNQTSSVQQHLPTAHQQILAGQQKTNTSASSLPLGLMGLAQHSAMVIQTKTSAPPTQAPSSSSTVATATSAALSHMQHTAQHTPSPPLQQVPHLSKAPPTNPMLHSLQSQSVARGVLSAVGSPPPQQQQQQAGGKPSPQSTSTITANVVGGGANLRTSVPTISPQSQARMGTILMPGGIQVPPHFETNLHDMNTYNSAPKGVVRNAHSPPPAHQQASPITPNDATFPGGPIRAVPTREHLMIYQQILRQHDALNPPALREYDEQLLGTSPPLELRRPSSVPRTVAVPHSLQSPQDRATDSPQVAQVYVHNARLPAHAHYDVAGRPTTTGAPGGPPSAYYDPARQLNLEPPPAHRSATAHSVVAPPPTVVVPHPSAGSSSPFMPSAPPATNVPLTAGGTSAALHHSKQLMEREREQRDREREQQLLREKEQILVRTGDAHNMQVTAASSSSTHQLPPHPAVAHGQVPPPPQADSLLTLLQRYPVMWQGLLALKTDQAAVQMHFVFGNPHVARASLPCNSDGSTPPLRIAQRMRLEQTQLEGVAKKMQFENEHCMLLALPCGRDHADVLQQSRNLQSGFITYLQQKMAAGIVNIPMPGSEQAAYVVHIFPSCDFANENLEKAAPDLKNRVADIAHLLIVIATV